jgi:S23 ribosomal protein.
MRNHKKYKVWQDSMLIVQDIYTLSASFPEQERFGLISQIQRAAVSIPSNIAEGSARTSDKEFSRFLEISLGSAREIETQIILANRLGYITDTQLEIILDKIDHIEKQLYLFINRLK